MNEDEIKAVIANLGDQVGAKSIELALANARIARLEAELAEARSAPEVQT